MKNKRIATIGITMVFMAVLLACSFSASTANIKEATMAREVNGSLQATSTFAPQDVFYCVVDVANAPDDTVTKAMWYVVDVPGIDANYFIDESELTGGPELTFNLTGQQYWPDGKYKVELYLNGELDTTLEFSVSSTF